MVDTPDLNHLTSLVAEHICAVRDSHAVFSTATFVINVEANMAYVAETLEAGLPKQRHGRMPAMIVLRENRKRKHGGGPGERAEIEMRAGTLTTNATKLEMVEVMRGLLRTGSLKFSRPFVTVHSDLRRLSAAMPRDAIPWQFAQFKQEEKHHPSRGSTTRPPTLIFSGKYGQGRDDFVMCVLMSVFYADVFLHGGRQRGK